ncbi:calcineurin-like phosphoesterase [Astrocystis sublimbata]|nr:calcineurin-like phosphoesterase [Astrocystis sublimbata]
MSESSLSPNPSSRPQQRTRRTRIVCISDTHNCTVKLPKGDVLIHGGDLTNQGSLTELSKQVAWLEAADFECKIVVGGNHDLTLDTAFMASEGAARHNTVKQIPAECQALLTQSPSLTYLLHESRTIKLTSPSGPRTTFSVFGSPYSPRWGGAWAFQYARPHHVGDDESVARDLWGAIPLDTDILITHGPPLTHCDMSRMREHAGCEVLTQHLWRVRPRLALCGHIHEARGVERVRWSFGLNVDDNGMRRWFAKEAGRTPWADPSPDSLKNALVDLTAKGGMPLDNDGGRAQHQDSNGGCATAELETPADVDAMDIDSSEHFSGNVAHPRTGTMSFGKIPYPDWDHDQAAIAGRLGRRETCVVNCAIQSSSYPHAGHGPRKLNKPIVVDLDLPVWEE